MTLWPKWLSRKGKEPVAGVSEGDKDVGLRDMRTASRIDWKRTLFSILDGPPATTAVRRQKAVTST